MQKGLKKKMREKKGEEEERRKKEEEKKREEEEEERRREEERKEEERKITNKHKQSKRYSNENIDTILPKKVYRDDDMNNIGNNNIIHKNEDRQHKKVEINDTNYNNKVVNKLKIENNNNDNIKSETSKKEIVITEITNPKLKRSFDSGNNNTSYKKPIQKYTNKNTTI